MIGRDSKPLVAVLSDLIFETKIRSTAKSLGVAASIIRSAGELPGALDRVQPGLVIVDLDSLGVSALEALNIAVSHSGRPHVVAFLSHVNVEFASRAKGAGANAVLPRSQFSDDLSQMVVRHCLGEPDTPRSSEGPPRLV